MDGLKGDMNGLKSDMEGSKDDIEAKMKGSMEDLKKG